MNDKRRHDKVFEVAFKVTSYVLIGSLGWIAKQDGGGFGFAVNMPNGDGKFAYFTDEQIDTMTIEEMVEDAYEQITGNASNSKADLEARLNLWSSTLDGLEKERQNISVRIDNTKTIVRSLQLQIDEIKD